MKHEFDRCQDCPKSGQYTAGWGDHDSDTAVVGTQPGDQHPDDSECCFGLDLDRTAWSGEIIEEVFEELNVDKSDLYWTNAVKCVEAGNRSACASTLTKELSTFSKIILLGNETVDLAPEFHGCRVFKIWHPAYVSRNRQKLGRYRRKWAEVLGADSPTTLADY